MPKVQIELNQDTYDKLKIEAKSHYQSLRGYIANHMTQFINNPDMFITTPNLPEGATATVKVKAQKQLTSEEIEEQKKQKFLDLCKEMYGEKFYKEYEPDIVRGYLTLTPNMSPYYDSADEPPPGKYVKAVYTMPLDMQEEYIKEMKHYLEEG